MSGAFAVPGHFHSQIPANSKQGFAEETVCLICLIDTAVSGQTI